VLPIRPLLLERAFRNFHIFGSRFPCPTEISRIGGNPNPLMFQEIMFHLWWRHDERIASSSCHHRKPIL